MGLGVMQNEWRDQLYSDGWQLDCYNHYAVHTNAELCCTTEIYVMLDNNFTTIKKK